MNKAVPKKKKKNGYHASQHTPSDDIRLPYKKNTDLCLPVNNNIMTRNNYITYVDNASIVLIGHSSSVQGVIA